MTFGKETKISAVVNISELIDVQLMIHTEEDQTTQMKDQKDQKEDHSKTAAILPSFQKDNQKDHQRHVRNKLHHLDHKEEKLGDLMSSKHAKIRKVDQPVWTSTILLEQLMLELATKELSFQPLETSPEKLIL